MKEIFKKKKSFIATLALTIGIFAVSSTMAMLVATTGSVTNTFAAGEVNTVIEEKKDDQPVTANTAMLKQPLVKNEGPSNAFVRARITVSPSDAGVKLYAGTWSADAGADKTFTQELTVYDGNEFHTNGLWEYYNGYFYYTTPIQVGEETATIFDAVKLEESANITIYQESVYSERYEPETTVDAETIEGLFNAIEK